MSLDGISTPIVIGLFVFAAALSLAMLVICLRASKVLAVVIVSLLVWAFSIAAAVMLFVQVLNVNAGNNTWLYFVGVAVLALNLMLGYVVLDELAG